MLGYQEKKINIGAYISILIIILILITIFFIMYKYNVEGEAVPPFKISKMIVVSSAKTENLELVDGIYNAEVLQNNDIKISIEKNPEYKKEAIIKKITINNIQINPKETKGNIEIYRPSQGEKLYEYQEQYKISEKIEYIGAQETYTKGEELQISNQGGIIDFSIIVKNLGTITYNENEAIKIDGTLLKQIGIQEISYQVNFDLIIELENEIKLKTKITLDLPTGDILNNGIETTETTDMKTVFKRI